MIARSKDAQSVDIEIWRKESDGTSKNGFCGFEWKTMVTGDW